MNIKRISFVFLFLLITVFFASKTTRAEDHLNLRYSHGDGAVGNMPMDFRLVRIHEQDTYANPANNGPVAKTDYHIHNWFAFEYGKGWKKDDWEFGIGFIWFFSPGNMARRNYTNAPGTSERGTGAALTFVSLGTRGILPNFSYDTDLWTNITPKVFIEYTMDPERHFKLNISLSYYQLQAIRGWDRYDQFETKDTKTLAHVFPITTELVLFNTVSVGTILNFYGLTDFGKNANASIGPISFTVGYSHTL